MLNKKISFSFLFLVMITGSLGQISLESYIPSLLSIGDYYALNSSIEYLTVSLFVLGMIISG